MRLKSIKVRLFRSIRTELELSTRDGLALVGPNNAGKSNALLAIETFFTGRGNGYEYDRDVDLSFGAGQKRTTMVGTFEGDPALEHDKVLLEQFAALAGSMGKPTPSNNTQFSLYLEFSAGSNPTYKLFPGAKRPGGTQGAKYSKSLSAFVDAVVDEHFQVVYVPSNKTPADLFEELAGPLIRNEIARVLKPHRNLVARVLRDASDAISQELQESGVSIKAKVTSSGGGLRGLLQDPMLVLEDSDETAVEHKGMGIQSTALFAAFRWIDQRVRSQGKDVLWLIEEPESFLHPSLSSSCRAILRGLEDASQVVYTTHSIGFVPEDPTRLAQVCLGDDGTTVETFRSWSDATKALRSSLGVRFSDFFPLGRAALLVEGPTDRELLRWILEHSEDLRTGHPEVFSNELEVHEFGGVKPLESFLIANYRLVRGEVPTVAVFDGDEAGQRAVRSVKQYLGRAGTSFQSNLDYVVVRKGFPIEALFPDDWIVDCHDVHPGWFEYCDCDVSGDLVDFRIKDSKKDRVQAYLKRRAEVAGDMSWRRRWADLLDALEGALARRKKRLRT